MPIPYENLKYEDILCHQEAYNYFDDAGRHLFDEWDMVGFEKAVLGAGDNHYLYMAEKIKAIPTLYHDLNVKMPFLRFQEDGQHYGYELFLSPPSFWGSRGAPLWWAYAARQFTYDKLPMDEDYFFEKYKGIAREFGLKINGEEYTYIERFAAGGMSSGQVGERFIREGWYTVRRRNRLYQKPRNKNENLYLDTVKEKILWFCSKYKECEYAISPNFNSELFIYALEDSKASDYQKEVATTMWGIYSGKPMTVRETADKYGVTPSRIYQMERRILHHITENKNRPLAIEKD